MKKLYQVRYITKNQPLREIEADEIKYAGGDSDTIVSFYEDNRPGGMELIAVVSMQAGMSVERVVRPA